MNETPDVGLLTAYLLENPWPLGTALLVVGLAVGFHALREGLERNLRIALVTAGAGVAVLAIGYAVTTAGEQARVVARSFVRAAAAGDVVGATALLDDTATMSFGSRRAPGIDHEALLALVNDVSSRYRVASNRITRLDGYTIDTDRGQVHLACLTELESDPGFGPTPSSWILEIERDAESRWRIVRLTLVEVASRKADSGMVR